MRTWLGILLLCLGAPRSVRGKAPYTYLSELGGVKSAYTDILKALVTEWPPVGADLTTPGENPVRLRCFQTPGSDYLVGVEQVMRLTVPRATVEQALDNFNGYASFFPGYEDIHFESNDENLWVTYWEQIIPLFFVPNIKYQMLYVIDRASDSRHVYRYQLKSAVGSLKSSDGVIVLPKEGDDTSTLYAEYDFFEPDTSIISSSRIWRESVQDIYLSDLGIKLKTERPELKGDEIKKAAEAMLEKFPVEDCLEHKTVFYKFNIAPK